MNKIKQYGNRLFSFTKNTIRAADMFPSKVELTFKGNPSFTTLFGGVISLFIKTIVIMYSVYLMVVVFRRTNSSKSVNRVVRDRSHDTTKHYIGRNNFAFAIKLVGPDSELIFDQTYFELVVSYSHYTMNEQGTFINWNHTIIEMEH